MIAHSRHAIPAMSRQREYCGTAAMMCLSTRIPLRIRHGISEPPAIIITMATVLLATPTNKQIVLLATPKNIKYCVWSLSRNDKRQSKMGQLPFLVLDYSVFISSVARVSPGGNAWARSRDETKSV